MPSLPAVTNPGGSAPGRRGVLAKGCHRAGREVLGPSADVYKGCQLKDGQNPDGAVTPTRFLSHWMLGRVVRSFQGGCLAPWGPFLKEPLLPTVASTHHPHLSPTAPSSLRVPRGHL